MTIWLKLTNGLQPELSHYDVKQLLDLEKEPSETDVMRYLQEKGFFKLQYDSFFVYFPNAVIGVCIEK